MFKDKREIIVVWSCHAPLPSNTASTHIDHVEKQNKNKQVCVCFLTSLSRSSAVVFAWLRPECSSADQIHTEEDQEEDVEDLDVEWLLWENASVLSCDSLQRNFLKDEKQAGNT